MFELQQLSIPHTFAPRKPKYKFSEATETTAINCGKYSKANRLRVAAAAYQYQKRYEPTKKFILRKVSKNGEDILMCWKVNK